MKVVFTHTDFRIYWPARLEALYKFLESKNIELYIIEIAGAGSPYSFAGNNSSQPPYWYCLFPGRKIEELPSVLANKSLYRKLNEIQPDIVFCGAIAYPSGATGVKWSLKNKKKCIVFDNARLQDVQRKWYVNYLKRKVYSAVDAIFCPAPAWIDTFNFFGFREDQIFFGVNATDNSFWLQSICNGKNGEYLPDTYLVAVGRQISIKNFISLLKAYQIYSSEIINPITLILIGEGPERKNLEEFVKTNSLHNVLFKPFLSQKALSYYYQKASFLILPSHNETWGLVVNEAMASGLPVLVSNQVGCASTLVKEGENGFTFSPDDVEELSGLLLKAGSMDEYERRQMGLKSKEIISDWGLERFCSGAYQSIQYVCEQQKRIPDLLGRIIINIWKGRYRPV